MKKPILSGLRKTFFQRARLFTSLKSKFGELLLQKKEILRSGKELHSLLFVIMLIFFGEIYAEHSPYSIVFAHLGSRLPDYLPTTVAQARLFNKNAKIFVILNDVCLTSHLNIIKKLDELNVQFVTCEKLELSEPHKRFIERFVSLGIDGYHRYTKERFFYIDELIHQYLDFGHLGGSNQGL